MGGHSELAARRVFRIYILGCWLLSKRSYWKVCRRGAFQYPLFSFFYNNRSWTATFQDDDNYKRQTTQSVDPEINSG